MAFGVFSWAGLSPCGAAVIMYPYITSDVTDAALLTCIISQTIHGFPAYSEA